ncbi:MAG: acyl-CoA dehydrogenase [Gammaproteobacteria bacterium]|nr:acyl-CoA dehydrogenase [Gammaproteobacteria bacterium]
MTDYIAPVKDMWFVLQELADLDEIAKLPGNDELSADLVQAVLEQAGKFAADVLAPLNVVGDRTGARWHDGAVTTAPGFKDAYRQFVDNGWPTLACARDFGGQGMPYTVASAVHEMWKSANLAFSLCPMLTQGAVAAIAHHASAVLKATYLPKMVSGEWTGTMNLTEPQAGSDLAAVRTRAVADGDHYRLAGTKIFITWGEHDYTDNIVHLVLARLPDAPEGVKGISLFIVPKFLLNADGSLGQRNDVRCVSLEHKLGIHGSPTAMMAYGDNAGAIGYLVGTPHRGLEYMFTMMNHARLAVGLEGVAISERAYQQALAYAKQRVQGQPIGAGNSTKTGIIHHPDVRRMLMSMKTQIEAMRALAYVAASYMDRGQREPDAKRRERYQALIDFFTPVVKGWCTEQAIEITSTGIQVHGGTGYIEETGAAQHLRDARIIAIYEGTTGIQAMDLVGRKVARDGGAIVAAVIVQMSETATAAATATDADLNALAKALTAAVLRVQSATEYVARTFAQNPRAVAAGSVPYLMLLGTVCAGWQMTRAALVADRKRGTDSDFCQTKIVSARFYADHILPRSEAYWREVVHGAESTLRLNEAQF